VSSAEEVLMAFEALGPSLHQAAVAESSAHTEQDIGLEELDGSLAELLRGPDVVPKNSPAFAPQWLGQFPRILEAAAAAVLIVLGVLTWMLFGDLARLKDEVNALRNENSDLREQLPALHAEVQQLRQAQADLLNAGSQVSVALNDAGGVVALNKDGNLVGLGPLSPSQEKIVKTALTTGRMTTPAWLAEIRTRDDALMSGGTGQESFRLLSPVGTALRTDRPAFRWDPLAGATSYTVTVSDSNFNQVATSGPLSGTEWTLPRPLARGAVYNWEVTALKDGKEIVAPAPPAHASFRVVETTRLEELEQAERANSHLLSGVLSAGAGLLDDAERAFQKLANANPGSPVAVRLLESIKSARSSSNTKRR
jgi:hypothetical protein